MRPLILSSSSVYRQMLLARLKMPFTVQIPDIDETPQPEESAVALVCRLSEAKARAIVPSDTRAMILGADQVGVLDGQILGKPADHTEAVQTLSRCSGRAVLFYSGICIYIPETAFLRVGYITTTLYFRVLSTTQIERYIALEPPYACAGSLQVEGLGLALIARIESPDPTAIVGLPLIQLTDYLAQAGEPVLGL